MRIVMLGAPGSGKGTQAKALARHFRVPHVSTGELLRRQVAAGTELGRAVADIVDRGDLVPDDVMARVVAEALPAAGPGYILDGFPRGVASS
jgi:adenylate kinase